MDTSVLRWALIIGGLILIAAIFLLGSPNRNSAPRSSRKRKPERRGKTSGDSTSRKSEQAVRETSAPEPRRGERREPTLDPGKPVVQGELEIAGSDGQESANEAPAGPAPDKVVVLYLQARDNRQIDGVELLESALKSGLVFGAMDIFHRLHEGGDPGDKRPIFSMANLTKPGTFDKQAWHTTQTKGVTMFMTLPGPLNALDAWDSMLATCRRMSEMLHTDLLDGQRAIFTRESEGRIRADLRAYERSLLPEE